MISEKVIEQAASGQMQRNIELHAAWEAYKGRMKKPLKFGKDDPDDNVRLNYAKPIVNDGVGFLFGDTLTFEVGEKKEGKESKRSPEEIYLDGVWKQNKQMTLLTKAGTNGAVYGDVYFKLRTKADVAPLKFPKLVLLDPTNVFPIYESCDFEDVFCWVISWTHIDAYTMKAEAHREIIERNDAKTSWTITHTVSKGDSRTWSPVGEPITWPYSWAPIFHCQNYPVPNEFFGASDLESDLVEIMASINMTVSNVQRILRFHAHPQTYSTGMGSNQKMIIGPDKILHLPQNATLQNLEMTSDLESSITTYDKLKEAMHEIASHPEIASGKMENVGQLSGLALQILYRPLMQKTHKKRLTYGDMLMEINQRLLELEGMKSDADITIHWPNMLPTDSTEEATTAVVLDGLGVSKDTLLSRLGFDPEQEAEKKAKEAQTAADMGSEILKQFDKGTVPGQSATGGNPAQDGEQD